MPVTTTIKNPNELHVIFKPNYRLFLLIALVFTLQALINMALRNLWYMTHWFLLALCLGMFGFSFMFRSVSTTINLLEKSIHFKKGGLLNSSVFSFEKTYKIADLSSIQIVRETRKKLDWFGLRLLINQSKSLSLADEMVSLEDTKKIRDFVGTHIPVVTVG